MYGMNVKKKMWLVFEEVKDITTRLKLSTERAVFKVIVMKNNLPWCMRLLSLWKMRSFDNLTAITSVISRRAGSFILVS
jgi:hypothetical protein